MLVLLDLVKDAGRFIGSLALLEKGYEPKQVCGHHLVCFRELVLMCHRPLLMRCGQLHCSTDVATIEVAEEL